MKPDGAIKLVSQLLDLPLVDKDGRWCGVVDDVEFDRARGKPATLKALLVGPGAYKGRLPAFLYWLVRKVAGDRIARVPMAEIKDIAATVQLKCAAEDLGLLVAENKAQRWIPRVGAM